MIELQSTETFDKWIASIRNWPTKKRILARLQLLAVGHFGDMKAIRDGVCELRLAFGPGYRIYFIQRGETLILLLAGGEKRGQDRDIARAIQLSRETQS